MFWLRAMTLLLAPLLLLDSAKAEQPAPKVEVQLSTDGSTIEPGKPFTLNIDITIESGWHIYGQNPGDVGKPTELDLKLPPGFSAEPPVWSEPETFEEDGFRTFGYTRQTRVTVVVTPAAEALGNEVTIGLEVSWLACKKSCIPGTSAASITLPAASVRAGTAVSTVLYFLLLSFLGGLILNLMPCVLPVVSLKVLSFARQAGEDRRRIFRLGMAYSAGTIAMFVLLALSLICAREFGMAVGWGFQFQHPAFLLAMSALMLLMSLSLFGLFEINVTAGQQRLGAMSGKEGYKGAFFTGVLATLLSTPCSAPFVGVALGFALVQPWWLILLVFLCMGAGLSAPYLVLTWKPVWLRLLPKPGDWLLRFKELMAFPMLLTGIWLLSVLLKQAGPDAIFPTLALLLALAGGAWLVGHYATIMHSRRRRVLVWLLAISLVATVATYSLPAALTRDQGRATGALPAGHEAWSEQAVQRHLQAGKVVIVDFTADWCLTCKVYERTVLASADVQAAIASGDVVVLRADWSGGDATITEKLREFGRSGVPLYVVYSPHRPDKPVVMPDLLTTRGLLDAIEQAAKP